MDFKKNPKTRFKDAKKIRKGEAKEEIEALREGINYHDYLYYVKNDPKISDATYDKLFSRLQELEAEFPQYRLPDSPTKRVGAKPVSKLKKVKHTSPMLSLNAAGSEKQIDDFDTFIHRNAESKKITYVLEPKFDGLSVEVVYENGALKYGATRGDGETGEDVTKNLRTVRSVPLHLQGDGDIPSFLAVRGEILMTKSGFQKMNKKRVESGETPFANPRNAAAGLMRQLDPRNVVGKPFDVFFYEVLDMRGKTFDSHWEKLQTFPKWGLKVNSGNKKVDNLDELKKYHRDFEKDREKEKQVLFFTERLNKLLQELSPQASEEKKAAVESYFWLIEEYKVSVFAQELKTPVRISKNRLEKKLQEIERMA